jgi:hypothetical protein
MGSSGATKGELHLVDASTDAYKAMAIAPDQGSCQLFLVHERREVWVFDNHSRIYRHATPRYD